MTITEFTEELAKVRSSFHWALMPDTSWKPERRSKRRFHICATSKGPWREVFEPLGAVWYARTGEILNWVEAGRSLGLSAADAWYVMGASNDLTWREVGGVREPHPMTLELRRKLAEIVGLMLEVERQDHLVKSKVSS
jgi:hypothetical protein